MTTPVALGLEMTGSLPEGALVVDVLLIAKALDAEGDVMLVQMASPGLTTWEATGMAVAVLDSLRGGLREMFIDDEDDDG